MIPGEPRVRGAHQPGDEVISMGLFLSIRALHEEGVSNKAIARRLGVEPAFRSCSTMLLGAFSVVYSSSTLPTLRTST